MKLVSGLLVLLLLASIHSVVADSYISQYQGSRILQIEGEYISQYQGSRLFTWDGRYLSAYQDSRIFEVQGSVPVVILALLAAGYL